MTRTAPNVEEDVYLIWIEAERGRPVAPGLWRNVSLDIYRYAGPRDKPDTWICLEVVPTDTLACHDAPSRVLVGGLSQLRCRCLETSSRECSSIIEIGKRAPETCAIEVSYTSRFEDSC